MSSELIEASSSHGHDPDDDIVVAPNPPALKRRRRRVDVSNTGFVDAFVLADSRDLGPKRFRTGHLFYSVCPMRSCIGIAQCDYSIR